jgi:hypothetical protein
MRRWLRRARLTQLSWGRDDNQAGKSVSPMCRQLNRRLDKINARGQRQSQEEDIRRGGRANSTCPLIYYILFIGMKSIAHMYIAKRNSPNPHSYNLKFSKNVKRTHILFECYSTCLKCVEVIYKFIRWKLNCYLLIDVSVELQKCPRGRSGPEAVIAWTVHACTESVSSEFLAGFVI